MALQWIVRKHVSILSTIHSGNCQVMCERRTKRNGKYEKVRIPLPLAIRDYNQFMNSVDRSDQMVFKTLLFYLADIAVVNGYLLFLKHGKNILKAKL